MRPFAASVTRRLALVAAAVAMIGLVASGALPGFADAVAYLLPPALLLLTLAARRYPGEEALLALIERERHKPTRSPIGRIPAAARPRAKVPRGGLLIAASLAERPPPTPARFVLS